MSFGFGVGDFIAVGNTFIKIYAALKDSTGSAAEFQSLKLLRGSLGTALAKVQARMQSATPFAFPESLVNAVTVHLDHCSRLLKRFDEITQKYAISLAPGGSTNKGRDALRKIQWGKTKDETEELFRRFMEQMGMIQTLFTLHNTCRTEELYVVSQRRQLAEVPQNLGWGDNKPIKFIDACDRRFTVPYEWCLTWQRFCEAIRVNHIDPQERIMVDSGSFEIFDEDNKAAMISSASWDVTISPGKTLSMAMRLKKQVMILGTEQECPTCGSRYKGYGNTSELERVRCTDCGTWFQVSSQPRIAELSENNSIPALDNPADDGAQALMSIRRWHVEMEQAKRYNYNPTDAPLIYPDLDELPRRTLLLAPTKRPPTTRYNPTREGSYGNAQRDQDYAQQPVVETYKGFFR